MTDKNIILKGIGGFYYVKTNNGVLECRAKGIFRKQGITPVAGDYVELEEEAQTYVVSKIMARKNVFVRPPVANIDNFFIVASTKDPVPNTLVIDKLLAIAVEKGAKPFIIVTKIDVSSADYLKDTYEKCGVKLFFVNALQNSGSCGFEKELCGKTSVFCGNSGVGKSTLLSSIMPEQEIQTAHISKKLKRGRHTTRQVALYEYGGGFVVDTPGFGSLEMEKACIIKKDNLQYDFVEFEKYIGKCKFTDCSHTKEVGCAVRCAVEQGEIGTSRYENYKLLYGEALKIESKNF